jgi:lipoate-protein ligase A
MRQLDFSFRSPAKNLALDEALLDYANDGEVLRLWESPVPFVVLGVSQVLRAHVRESACIRDRVPILRRCSAGGCVLQGPGCLNFTLVLQHANKPEIRTIRESYCFVLGRLAEALLRRGVSASHKGVSDLAIAGHKISGNAQKRRPDTMLHHGTLLYGLDPELMERYLRDPVDRPQYRGDRSHCGFVTSIPLTKNQLKEAIIDAFGADTTSSRPRPRELHRVKQLVEEKYGLEEWIRRR